MPAPGRRSGRASPPGSAAAARMRATASLSSIRQLSRIAARSGGAGGNGVAVTISMRKILAWRRQNALYPAFSYDHTKVNVVCSCRGHCRRNRFRGTTPPPQWHVLGRLEKTAIGTRGAGGVTSVRRREPAGCLLFGPYWQLRAGSYRLSFRCRPGKPRLPSEPVLGVEVIAMNRVQLAWRDLTAAELQGETGSLDFTVPPALGLGAGDEARLEFRFFHLSNADLTITAVDLQGMRGYGDAFRPRLEVWRMLGRLDGGRSFLQLPAGHYRLEIRSDADPPRMAAQPVLGVEITARRRWQDGRWWSWNSLLGLPPSGGVQLAWRDFTSAELSCGAASFDFEVPTELALEGGQDIVIGLRLVRLGNAGLTVRAVDLRLITEAEAAPAAREWRLLGRLSKGRIGAARKADCVTVRHSDPAGSFLYGSRPRLRLPRGRYRLSFCCRAGQPRMASQPVLGVEVICAEPVASHPRLDAHKDRRGGRAAGTVRVHLGSAGGGLGLARFRCAAGVELRKQGRGRLRVQILASGQCRSHRQRGQPARDRRRRPAG